MKMSSKKPSDNSFQKNRSINRHKNSKKKFRQNKNQNSRFLANAKGFGRKGNFGRGTHIEEDQFTYFIGILETLNKEDVPTEQKVSMANNVMEQSLEKEIHLASNQVVSKVLEGLMSYADPEHLERFIDVFGENLRPICSDPYASHVLQKMVEIAFIRAVALSRIEEEEGVEEDEIILEKKAKIQVISELNFNVYTEFTEDHRTKCSEFVQRVSKFLLNNLEDFVWDFCACHLIRTCVLALAGVHIPKVTHIRGKLPLTPDKVLGSKASNLNDMHKSTFEVPEEWTELMKEFPSRLEMWPQFKDFPYKEKSAGLAGIICIALSHVDKSALKHFGKKLLNDAFMNVAVPENQQTLNTPFKAEEDESEEQNEEKEEKEEEEALDADEEKEKKSSDAEEEKKENDTEKDDWPSVFKVESAVRLLETLMSSAGPKLITEIYSKLFAGRVVQLAKYRQTSFPVQKLINYVKDKTLFESIFDELIEHIDLFLKIGNHAIISVLSAGCLRLNTKQAALITALQNALHCAPSFGVDRPKFFLPCMLKMKPFEVLPYDRNICANLFGSLIIQNILRFNKPIFMVNCILETPAKDLVPIMLLPNGSYITDVFLSSKFIGEKSREKYVKLFEGFYMDMALGRCGSRVVEKLFAAANEGQKLKIAKELTGKENKLRGNSYGRIIFNVLRLETFKLSPEQWKASWTAKTNKGDKMLETIVNRKRAIS